MGPYYHIIIKGAVFTYTTNSQEVAAHHQIHGAEVWATDYLKPDAGEARFPDVRPFYKGHGSLSCNYCGFGNPCQKKGLI